MVARKRRKRTHLPPGDRGLGGRAARPPVQVGERAGSIAVKKAPKSVLNEHDDWVVVRVRNEITNQVFFHVKFPTSSGTANHVFGVTATDDWANVLKRFRSYEAKIPGETNEQRIGFLKARIASANVKPLIGTSKPGFTASGKGFVLGHTMLGDAAASMFWLEDPSAPVTLGISKGSSNEYRKLTKLLSHTGIGTLAVLAVLSSAVRAYLKHYGKVVEGASALVSETATFNLAAGSGSGKTLPSRIAASVTGEPDDIGTWEGFRRGQEEYLSSRNQVGAIFDDVEKLTNASQYLKAAIEVINQSVPGGRTKSIAKKATLSGLPYLTWDTFALSSSPKTIDVILSDRKFPARTKGEKVRLFDLTVPPVEEGGCFDERPKGADPIQFGIDTSGAIEALMVENYGHLFKEFVGLLLKKNLASEIVEHANVFVTKTVSKGNAYDVRYARKFGLLYSVGEVINHYNLVEWPKEWPFKAVSRCYRSAIFNSRNGAVDGNPQATLYRLMSAYTHNGFVWTGLAGKVGPLRIGDDKLGLVHQPLGKLEFLCVFDDKMSKLAGSSVSAERFRTHLRELGLLGGGHGAAGTAQETVPIRRHGKVTTKPRVWRLDHAKFVIMLDAALKNDEFEACAFYLQTHDDPEINKKAYATKHEHQR
jgi:hypothetical protein